MEPGGLGSMGSQTVRCDLATKQQQRKLCIFAGHTTLIQGGLHMHNKRGLVRTGPLAHLQRG